MKRSLPTTVHLLRHFGPGWLMFRAGYALRKRSGILRRSLPPTSWEAQPLAGFLSDRRLADADDYARYRIDQRVPFFFDGADRPKFRPQLLEWDAPVRASHLGDVRGSCSITIADALCDGVFRFFEHLEMDLGCPPDWHRHPVTGDRFPSDRHWSEIDDFAAGDIKFVWEPSRFAWVYPLVRAYWRTGDERYARLFWELVEDWRTQNPPQQGVNWKCGQEVALRVMACCFGLYGFAGSPETTAPRVARLAQMMAISGQRIESNLNYAISQQNNHGISEATGLWTLGLLFPEFAAAARWRQIGRRALEEQCRRLIDDDGAFSQHSVNYQRVMLHACLWSIRLGDLHGQPPSEEMRDRVGSAGTFLWQLQDAHTGRLPRYGANDGALVLPLTNCPPDDYRSVIQSTEWLRNHSRRFEPASWDEELLWLFGPDALAASVNDESRRDWHTSRGGYCVLRSESGHLFTRAGSYRHRPSQADMLHVDIWWRGQNIALDPGTFTYNAPPPWDSPLGRTVFHNTVTVDERDQMDRRGRFLWLPWLSGRQRPLVTSANGHLTYWEGSHDGYRRLTSPVFYRRGILRIGAEHWLVIDELTGTVPHTYRLHWLLLDVPCETNESQRYLRLQTDAGPYDVRMAATAPIRVTCVRADPQSPRGWYAPSYGDRQPALSWACEAVSRSVTFATFLGPSSVCCSDDGVRISADTEDWSCLIERSPPDCNDLGMIASVTISGTLTDRLSASFAPRQ